MNIKTNIRIRPIKEEDKGPYLRLFNNEDFGCVGMYSNLKPSIYAEERAITRIIDKSNLSEEVLIIEDNEEFIGYALISRESEHVYHIGQFVIRKDKQGQGYGKTLMKEIKKYASSDDCAIELECLTTAREFFIKQGFENHYETTFTYPRKKAIIQKRKSLFVDYQLIKQEEEKQRITQHRKRQKSFQKFLQSPLFKD